MNILLNPDDNKRLVTEYAKALACASELSILTAYLTDWNPTVKLSPNCTELNFIVGTDFGITKKDACLSVLKWLPKNFKNDFLAADALSGFHPKVLLWKSESSQCYIILGSSNLTQAAFSKNVEANFTSSIPLKEYDKIKEWIYKIRNDCAPISEDWLKSYSEMIRKYAPSKKKSTTFNRGIEKVLSLPLPEGKSIDDAILRRRKQERAFASVKHQLIGLMSDCVKGNISNAIFYEKMLSLWNNSGSRLQGSGFQISGKYGNWREICNSLLTIIKSANNEPQAKLDNIVKQEIDKLSSAGNPLRGSWLSEMLCHFFPKSYPLLNKPIKLWLRSNKYRSARKSSQGSTYIDVSLKMRTAIKNNIVNKARNLSELDHAIWQWAKNKGLQ